MQRCTGGWLRNMHVCVDSILKSVTVSSVIIACSNQRWKGGSDNPYIVTCRLPSGRAQMVTLTASSGRSSSISSGHSIKQGFPL